MFTDCQENLVKNEYYRTVIQVFEMAASRKILLLMDLWKCDGNDDEVTMELAGLVRLLPHINLQVVVAFTSNSLIMGTSTPA